MPLRAVLDTNVLVSAIVYGGKPREILVSMVLERKIDGVISPSLLAELLEVLRKKFEFASPDLNRVERQIKRKFIFVYPQKRISILDDEPDNRVLEAAAEGRCDFIVTGDKELLSLKSFQGAEIMPPRQFIEMIKRLRDELG